MYHQSSSSKLHFDTMFVIICVIVGVTSHNISDTSKKPINRTNEYYRKSFIEIILDPNLSNALQSSRTVDKNLFLTQSNSKLIDAPFRKRSATVCALLSNLLSGDQTRFCQRHQDVLESILPLLYRTTEEQCKRITKDLKWNCPTMNLLFEKSSSLAYTREAALVRSILNVSMMYLVAKVCSENNHLSCGCLANSRESRSSEADLHSAGMVENFLNEYQKGTIHENQPGRSPRSPRELSHYDISKLNAGSPIRLIKSVEQRQGCIINYAFANAFAKVFIDYEDTRNLNKATRILNGDLTRSQSTRYSNIRSTVDTNDMDLAHIKWTKSAINLHNNQIGRKIVREATQRRCRCHGLSGTCQFQTCWEELSDISIITSRLKNIYIHNSAKTSSANLGSHERPDLYLTKVPGDEELSRQLRLLSSHDGDQVDRVGPEDLLYFYDSPEYCEPQSKLGHHGTKGRACIPSSNVTKSFRRTESLDERNHSQLETASEDRSPGTCERLCCNRGYQRELILDVVPCSCRFKFCCRVECNNCLRQIDTHYCL